MLLLETIRVAFSALRQNLMRSVLTMLGIVIGVGAVIAMDALGNGAKASIQERISKLGTNLLQIDAARVAQGGVAISGAVRLTEKDAQFLTAHSTKLSEILPQQDRDLQVVWRNHNVRAQITGAASNFLIVRRYELDAGRFFTSAEDVAARFGLHRAAIEGLARSAAMEAKFTIAPRRRRTISRAAARETR